MSKDISASNLVIGLYFSFNVLFGLFFLTNGELGGDFNGFSINNQVDYILIFATELLCMVVFFYTLKIISNIYKKRECNVKINFNHNFLSWFIFCLQFCFLIYVLTTGVGKLSGDFYNVQVDNPLKYVFTFFNADYLFLTLFSINPKKDYKNILLYLISNVLRGWLAGALLNVFLLMLLKKNVNNKINLKKIFLLSIIFITVSPSLYYIKYASRSSEPNYSLNSLSQYYSSDVYSKVMKAVFERFQHISETYSIVESAATLRTGYENKDYVPFYLDNFLKRSVGSSFGYQDKSITEFSAEEILGKKPGNIQVGILSWLIINPSLTILYIITIILCFFALCSALWLTVMKENIWAIALWPSAIFALHGWFSAFFMIIFSYYLMILISLIYNSLKLNTGKIHEI